MKELKEFTKEDYLSIYRYLYLIRRTEEKMVEYHHHTPITELPHVSIGQEAVSVGTCCGLCADDLVAPSLRTRGAFIVKGIPSQVMMAGAFAKDTQQTRGKNTSHHIGDRDVGVLAGTGIVGGHIPVAVGASLAAKLMKKDYVTVVYFGDGATNRGDFHEAVNLAAIWDLPIVFVCENNLYAISTPVSYSMRVKNIADRAAAYGIPGVIADGNDVLDVYCKFKDAYERAKAGQGPTLLECKTYRWRGHSERDPRDPRPPEEIEEWKKKCPVRRFREYLMDSIIATEAELEDIEKQVEEQVEADIRYAEDTPYPPVEVLMTNVYSNGEVM